MIKINVIVKEKSWLKFLKNPETYLKRKLKKVQNDKLFKKKNYIFNLKLSGSREIKYLNKKFRKINKSTDILSFPNQTKKNLSKLIKLNSEIHLGDIIINLKKIDTSSQILFRSNFDELWIHGLVHLFGYDHVKDNSYKRMHLIEKKLQKKIN
tara:strand:+ start:93 stop:551 length:459 start_codon:yes stop_codon:yes gene_type:complete